MVAWTKEEIIHYQYVFYWKHQHDDLCHGGYWYWCDFGNRWTLTKMEASWFVWISFVAKKFARTIEGPCQWILPILQTLWESGEGRGKEIMVDAQLFHETLKLPLLKIEVDGFKDNSTTPQAYFKAWKKAKNLTNGWKVVEASDPKMMEWMWFMCKRLALKLHPTYLTLWQ